MSSQPSNRLIHEKSPYLLQHAHNPVNWYPWSEETFQKARQEDKPVFLSIGYSTCHWCHVMEHESFEDPQTAEILNQYFVAIKVDREERPDVDSIYMSAVTAMTGAGGWPLSVFLTPEKQPFYGGTYFPPEPRWGSPGFKDLLLAIQQSWTTQRDQITSAGQTLTTALKDRAKAQGGQQGQLPDQKILDLASEEFAHTFDPQYGGFGQAPKFPMAHSLSFLLRYWQRTQKEEALNIVTRTLDQMALGGIFDHLGGGFHRYSTDQQWQVPHFEKMLYDQAMLSRAYLEAYQARGEKKYALTAKAIFDYVLSDLQDKDGGFYSAEDADSPPVDAPAGKHDRSKNKEGAFYLWTKEELQKLLTPQELSVFEFMFDILPGGNARHDPHGEFTGKNILWQIASPEETAQQCKVSVAAVEKIVAQVKDKLLTVRSRRPRPHLDDKILVDWNGLMLASLALGAVVLDEPYYRMAAERCAQFVLKKLKASDGSLLHRYRDGEAKIRATLDDYAFLVHGLLELYMVSFQAEYLQEAVDLSKKMTELFSDNGQGGMFQADKEAQDLILRHKDIYDGALPSGNSVALLNFIRLYHLTFDQKWLKQAENLAKTFSAEVQQRPSAYAQLLIGVDFLLGPVQEVVFVTQLESAETREILKKLYAVFSPRRVLIAKSMTAGKDPVLTHLAPFTGPQIAIEGSPTLYVCEGHVCHRPLIGISKIQKFLSEK